MKSPVEKKSGLLGLISFGLLVLCNGCGFAQAPQTPAVVEWQLSDGTVWSADASGPFGATGVVMELRRTAMAHGTRFDIRLRNRSAVNYTHTALRIRVPRAGNEAAAVIEGISVPLPAQVSQLWEAPPTLQGAKYGFTYEIAGGGTLITKAGPSAAEGDWGGRAAGIVRIDGKAYVVPEFWQRQPRTITVTANEIVLTLYDGARGYRSLDPAFDSTNLPLRPGEDAWDRFAVIEDSTLSDAAVMDEAEGLPQPTPAERSSLMQRFGIAPEGLRGRDSESEAWLRKYDQWQGVSWQADYADVNPARIDPINGNSGKTTLFTLFECGDTYAANSPGIYSWRDYGDIQWAEGMSADHYDWVRSAFKHYLRTGNLDALRWGMAALRHAISVDFLWKDAFLPNDAGFARYEKGNHGWDDPPGTPSHTWGDGLFLGAALTGDPWVKEAAIRRADGAWNYFDGSTSFTWDGAYAEIRWLTWPLLLEVRAFQETSDIKYWIKAKQLMSELLRAEQLSGGRGYIKDYAFASLGVGTPGAVWTLQHGYAVPGLLLYAQVAQSRGEWTAVEQSFLVRMGKWAATPAPNGPFVPGDASKSTSFLGDGWCPPGNDPAGCGLSPDDSVPSPVLNVLFADLFAWLAESDPLTWSATARMVFRDAMYFANHPSGIVGYLTDQFPGSESKVMGRIQLFGDRAAMWHAGMPVSR